MILSEIISTVRSGIVLISFYDENQAKIASGSGFLCRNYVISNNHVFHPIESSFSDDTDVRITFDSVNDIYEFKYRDLASKIVTGSPSAYADYIVLQIDPGIINGKYQFELGMHNDVFVGDQMLVAGFPFDNDRLTFHVGYISAKFVDGSIDTIQLDASINNGNSGGPLIDLKTLKVVGIVTRKLSGLENSFDQLLKSFEQNMGLFRAINSSGMAVSFGGINLFESMAVTQDQMKAIAQSLRRSANVGIGYAFSCDGLKKENFYMNP